jgi:putative SOS response-associated peptidase YedK
MPRDELSRALEIAELEAPELPLSWNVAPTQLTYVVVSGSQGGRRLTVQRWGLVPQWAKDPRTGAQMINARSETLMAKPAFRPLIGARRALVPVSGFYEWQSPGARAAGRRRPFYFCSVCPEPLVLAGLWDRWRGPQGELMETFTIVTTTANATMAPVHHRMPVVLCRHHWDEWLAPVPLPPGRLAQLLVPASEDLLVCYPVSTAVNNSQRNGADLIEPVDAPEVDFPTLPMRF